LSVLQISTVDGLGGGGHTEKNPAAPRRAGHPRLPSLLCEHPHKPMIPGQQQHARASVPLRPEPRDLQAREDDIVTPVNSNILN
jgi:hypothetical protein